MTDLNPEIPKVTPSYQAARKRQDNGSYAFDYPSGVAFILSNVAFDNRTLIDHGSCLRASKWADKESVGAGRGVAAVCHENMWTYH